MKIETKDSKNSRTILAGMILDRSVLSRISSKWEDDLLPSPWNIVGAWCVRHFIKYGKPPGKSVEVWFDRWAERKHDDDQVRLVESFLAGLSEEWSEENINSDHVLDIAGEYFNRIRLSKLAEGINSDLESGDVRKAEERLQSHRKVEIGTGAGVDLFVDESAVKSSFRYESGQTLVTYQQALGNFFGGVLERDAFVVFLAPIKTGKTFWMIDIAWRAMLERKRVAFFQMGDLSENQIKLRFMSRVAEHPHKSPDNKWPFVVKVPVALDPPQPPQSFQATVTKFEKRKFDGPLDPDKAWRDCERVMKTQVKSKRSFFKLSCHDNLSTNVLQIKSILESWQLQQDWTPDVLCIDYSDLLAPVSKGKMESRDQINETWKHLRGISSKFHCLLLTATQANALSLKTKEPLSRMNYSEDIRKLAHCTAMYGINVNEEEKDQGLARLNPVVVRESAYSPRRCCHIAGCLALSNPSILSTF